MMTHFNKLPAGIRAAIYMCLWALVWVTVLAVIVLVFWLVNKYTMWMVTIIMGGITLGAVGMGLRGIFVMWSDYRDDILWEDSKRRENTDA